MTASCVRRAWLTLGTLSLDLQNEAGGWFCTSLDLGYPEVRDVVDNRPDRDGVDDRTRLMGSRGITANITAIQGAGAQIDAVASSFAPFMAPAQRPVLHYILDRPGAAERVVTVRASGFSWPVAGPYERDIQLQWVAADPNVYDPTVKTGTAWAGGIGTGGRTYNLTFPRIYPAGGGFPTVAVLVNNGDQPVFPLVRVYGPITGALMVLQQSLPGGGWNQLPLRFKAGYVIDAGHWVDIDCAAHTVYRDSDPAQNVLNQIDWGGSTWLSISPAPAINQLRFVGGTGTTSVTQAQAIWQDAYLT